MSKKPKKSEDEEIQKMNIKNVDEARQDDQMHDDQGDLLEETGIHEDKKKQEE